MPESRGKKEPTFDELIQLAEAQLEQSILQPSILNYGSKEYPEQDRFFASQCDARFVSGGNRGGKTDALVLDAIWTATNTHPWRKRPSNWGMSAIQLRVVTVDIAKGVEQIMVPKFKRWCAPTMLKGESWDKAWDAKNLILTFANGSTIDFVTWGMDLMKLGGVPRHGIYFDEEPPRHIFNESMSRLFDYKGFWVIAATPTMGMGWTYDLLWEPAQDPTYKHYGKIDTFTLSAEQNPYNESTAEDRDFYMLGMDDEERRIRESGEFVARSGLVFPQINNDARAFIVSDFHIPRGWTIYSSVDHGWNNATAWLWHAVSPKNDAIITFAEHVQSLMTIPEHAVKVHEIERSTRLVPEIRTGDPAMKQKSGITGTNPLMEYARHGINIGVEGIPHEVSIGIEKMQQYLKIQDRSFWGERRPVWVISDQCPIFAGQMRKLRWKTYDSTSRAYEMNKLEEVHKKDDHTFDSARYFCTLMPDLALPATPATDSAPTTLNYVELMSRMSADSSTVWHGTASGGDGWEREIYESPDIYSEA